MGDEWDDDIIEDDDEEMEEPGETEPKEIKKTKPDPSDFTAMWEEKALSEKEIKKWRTNRGLDEPLDDYLTETDLREIEEGRTTKKEIIESRQRFREDCFWEDVRFERMKRVHNAGSEEAVGSKENLFEVAREVSDIYTSKMDPHVMDQMKRVRGLAKKAGKNKTMEFVNDLIDAGEIGEAQADWLEKNLL